MLFDLLFLHLHLTDQLTIVMKKSLLLLIGCVIFLSDANAQWQLCNDTACKYIPYCFIKSSGKLFLDGSCASIDNGVTWTGTNSGFCALSMGKNSAGLFAGSENAIYFSTNNGSSWTNVYTTGNNNITWGFAFLHDTVFAATFSSGIITSPDNGVTWYSSNMGLPNDTLLTVFSKDNILYAGTYGHGIYISIDAGNSWFPSYIGIPSGTYIKDFATDGVNIYATSYGTIYISNNGGTSWYAAPLIVGPTFTIAKIACISNAILAGGYTPAGAEGMYRSLDSGATWALFNMGLPTGCPYGIGAIYPTSAYAFCGMESNGCGTVFRIPISEVISSVKTTQFLKIVTKYIRIPLQISLL